MADYVVLGRRAAQAAKALRPTQSHQFRRALRFGAVAREELGHRPARLKLDSVHRHHVAPSVDGSQITRPLAHRMSLAEVCDESCAVMVSNAVSQQRVSRSLAALRPAVTLIFVGSFHALAIINRSGLTRVSCQQLSRVKYSSPDATQVIPGARAHSTIDPGPVPEVIGSSAAADRFSPSLRVSK